MAKQPPTGAICSGTKRTGLHLAGPGEQLVNGLCAYCRAEQKGTAK